MNNNKTIGITIAVIVVIVVVALLIGKAKNGEQASPSPSASVSVSPSASASPTAKAGGTVGGTTVAYADALTKYASRRIQFDARCQASPNQLTEKNGTAIMLDNRANVPRVIALDTMKYPMLAYGWRVITVSSRTLPHTFLIDCGTSQNVARITVER